MSVESILTYIKKLLGITEDYTHFDDELIVHINSILLVLTQVGVGPDKGFIVQDKTQTWDEFIPDGKNLEFVKTYVYLRVRLLFDPPQSGSLIEAINRNVDELTWRIFVATDPKVE